MLYTALLEPLALVLAGATVVQMAQVMHVVAQGPLASLPLSVLLTARRLGATTIRQPWTRHAG